MTITIDDVIETLTDALDALARSTASLAAPREPYDPPADYFRRSADEARANVLADLADLAERIRAGLTPTLEGVRGLATDDRTAARTALRLVAGEAETHPDGSVTIGRDALAAVRIALASIDGRPTPQG